MLHLNDFKSCQNIPPPDISKTKVLFIDAIKSKARLLKGSFRILEHSLGIKIVKLFEEVVYIMQDIKLICIGKENEIDKQLNVRRVNLESIRLVF